MKKDNQVLIKKLDRLAWLVTGVVLVAVVGLRYIPPVDLQNLPFDIHLLPALHAILNTLTAIALGTAIYFVKQKNISMHRNMIFAAMVFSALFLLSYVTYHFLTPPTSFGGQGIIKIVYLILLITHILAAAVILPFILFTFIRGYLMDVEAHKRIAKWTFPIWMYVAITGPICYLMLQPYY
jgi:putative membrane protein